MFRPLAENIAKTDLSLTLQVHGWIVPTSQSIHILSVCILFTCALVINSRILGIGSSGRSVPQLVDSLLPWMWAALAGLLITGTAQTIAEPVRQFITPMFWAKMAMIVVVALMTKVYTARIRAHASQWNPGSPPPSGARSFAVLSSLLWVAIIICGRFIGYTWALYL
jgi:uncharacterized membrane protein